MSDASLSTIAQGAYDETRLITGASRPGWASVVAHFEGLDAAQLKRHQRQVLSLLRAHGIAYGADSHGFANDPSAGDRPWDLDLIPQIIEPADWQRLEDGLVQRARLKQALLTDIYGPQSILTAGIIPPALLYAHRGYRRALRHMPDMHCLPLYAADVSRAPNGDWFVANDLCQSAAGTGYALENRLVLSRVLPGLFRQHTVSRLTGYFQALQKLLTDSLAPDSRCVMLGYSASDPHYFEYAYLSKYLGYTLVELNDLVVKEEFVWVKTVSGLQRVDVILRFVDDEDTDPLVTGSTVGIPGLLQVARAGNVTIINPVGTGALDNPGFDAYLPQLCRHFLDEEPLLASAPTYWLGCENQLTVANARLNELLFRDIDATDKLLDPASMSEQQLDTFQQQLALQPWRFVAQERIDRSFSPSLDATGIAAHQITQRHFLVGDQQSFRSMQGGLCLLDRIPFGRRPLTEAFEGSKDVWVLSDTPDESGTTLPRRNDTLHFAMLEGELPSRVADNLFWLGRYTERAENTIRILRVICSELPINETGLAGQEPSLAITALLTAVTAVTGTAPGFAGARGKRHRGKPDRELLSLFKDSKRNGTLPCVLQQMQYSASTLRDRLSPELLTILNDLDDQQQQLQSQLQQSNFSNHPDLASIIIEHLNAMLKSLAAFAGTAHENLTHADGWRFLMLGRRTDRARQGAAAIGAMLQTDPQDGQVQELLLRLFDGLMTYRSRYRSEIDPLLVLQLIVFDENNPRSIAFQFQQIDNLIQELPGIRRGANQSPLLRVATKGLSRVRLADAGQLLDSAAGSRQNLGSFLRVLEQIPDEISAVLTAAFFTHSEVRQYLEALSTDKNDAAKTMKGQASGKPANSPENPHNGPDQSNAA